MPARVLVAERLTEAMLDELARVTVQDLYNATAAWISDAPERHKARLDAITVNENGAS